MAAELNNQEQGGDGWEEENNLSKAKPKEGGGTGHMITEPDRKIEYIHCAEQNVYFIRLTNNSWRKVAWAHITRRLCNRDLLKQIVEPKNGVLDKDGTVLLTVTSYPFDISDLDQDERTNSSISFEWTNTPAGAGDDFDDSWFSNARAMVRTKAIKIDFKS